MKHAEICIGIETPETSDTARQHTLINTAIQESAEFCQYNITINSTKKKGPSTIEVTFQLISISDPSKARDMLDANTFLLRLHFALIKNDQKIVSVIMNFRPKT